MYNKNFLLSIPGVLFFKTFNRVSLKSQFVRLDKGTLPTKLLQLNCKQIKGVKVS